MAEQLRHEELDAYKLSMRFVKLIEPITSDLPLSRHAVDQLDQASSLIPIHIAKGSYRPVQRSEEYQQAIEAALECSSNLDVLDAQDLIEPDVQSRGKEMLKKIIQQLSEHTETQREQGSRKPQNPVYQAGEEHSERSF